MSQSTVVAWALAISGWGAVIDYNFFPKAGLYNFPYEKCEMMYPDPDYEGQSECLWILTHPDYYD